MNSHTVALTRVFEAPRERVFECWTRAEHLKQWFRPDGATIGSCETDPRPGGVFRLSIRFADGRDYFVQGSFREVRAPSRIVIDCTASDAKGVAQLEEVIDVTFSEAGGRTTVALKSTARVVETAGPGDAAVATLKGMDKGWAQTVDRLGTHLGK
jgi:uncharacterized protein YndB with AHSA1/START domain